VKLLLTGGTGFIGRVALRHLSSRGHEVISVIRSTVTPAGPDQVVNATLGSDDAIETILKNCGRCEAIVHVAACINYDNLCPDLVRVNCVGMQQLLTIAQEWRVRHFVNISGITVLGRPLEHPITEEHPTAPRTTYHATKLFGEHLLELASNSQLAGVSLRVTAPVGPGMPAGRILSVFVQKAIENQPLLLSGRGTRRQNYVDVRDIADAIVGCLDHRPRGVYNLGGPSTLSNLQLAESCIRALDSNSTTGFTGAPDQADDEVWDVSSDAAKTAFQYQPIHDIESSLKAVAHGYKSSSD
jgi:nucleoside-diphosphate-sugar epimerase